MLRTTFLCGVVFLMSTLAAFLCGLSGVVFFLLGWPVAGLPQAFRSKTASLEATKFTSHGAHRRGPIATHVRQNLAREGAPPFLRRLEGAPHSQTTGVEPFQRRNPILKRHLKVRVLYFFYAGFVRVSGSKTRFFNRKPGFRRVAGAKPSLAAHPAFLYEVHRVAGLGATALRETNLGESQYGIYSS